MTVSNYSDPATWDIWPELCAERQRAHAKHGLTSMEASPIFGGERLAILTEEIGEVAKELNDWRHASDPHGQIGASIRLRSELLQVATMAVAWIAAIDGEALV